MGHIARHHSNIKITHGSYTKYMNNVIEERYKKCSNFYSDIMLKIEPFLNRMISNKYYIMSIIIPKKILSKYL